MENGFNDTEREKEYVQMKECPRNESFADGNVGAGVRLMVRGGCLPVRWNDRMTWKYDDDKCRCGLFCFCFNIPQDPSRVLCGRDAR